ncbi:MAG: phosphate acyltransferase PlsX [Clostridia bacterium]|nr:phosphate acyltransferase PlsX [Clostridia bacterium]
MNIIIDAFGGDNAPVEIIKGAEMARKELSIDITLVGKEDVIRKVCSDNEIDADNFTIIHADEVIATDAAGTDVARTGKKTSMAVGLKALAEGKGDGFLSAGNSGAVCAGATLIVKRIKGISRPGFSPVIPTLGGQVLLMDSGANLQCRPEMLCQFGIMGSIYMNKVLGVENPRVGLLNVGTEEHKGSDLQHEAYELLKNAPVNFIGNVEGTFINGDVCDVVVCDGFSGNILLKTYEGTAMALMKKIKGIFTKNVKNKLAASMVLNDVKALKDSMNPSEVGGAPVLGCAKPVFKAHGNSDARAIYSALKLVKEYVENNVVEEIANTLKMMKTIEGEKADV